MTEHDADDERMVQVHAEVPKRTKDIAKDRLEHGGLTRLIRETLEQVAHGEQVAERERVKDHLTELRDQRRELHNERDAIENELADLEVKIERAETRIDSIRDKAGEYEGILQSIEQQMHADGMSVWPGHGQVKQAAEFGDCSMSDVMGDLRERNPDLPERQFTEGA